MSGDACILIPSRSSLSCCRYIIGFDSAIFEQQAAMSRFARCVPALP